MKPLCSLVIVVVAGLVAAAPASAGVTVEGTGEPAYTNSTQNTQWVSYQVPPGTDAYRLQIRYYRDNALVKEETFPVSQSGSVWMNWAGVATLQEGSQYGICVQGQYSFPNDSLYFSDGPNSCSMATMEGKRAYTTIDRTKPAVSISAAGGAEFTKDASIPLSIGFQDATAGPHPATFLCVKAGADQCDGGFQYSAACSQPAGPGKSTTFSCAADASQLPDGPVTVCAIGADAAVPDNPSSANQTGNASQSNRSDAQCDTVVLDRQAPALTLGASKTVFGVGESVVFSTDAGDSGSGLDANTARLEFGDGTYASPGSSVSRSFGQPGTYVVTFRAKDRAGNESVTQKSVTVQAPSTGDVATPPPNDNPSTPPPVTGNPGLASVKIGSVTVLVPKRVRLGNVRQLLLGARTDQAGVLTLRLTRGKKVYSRMSARLAPGESRARLRLPKGLKAGAYAVKIAFKPTGARWTAAGTAKVAFQKAK